MPMQTSEYRMLQEEYEAARNNLEKITPAMERIAQEALKIAGSNPVPA